MAKVKSSLMSRIRDVLMQDWDPIGIKDLPEKYRLAAADEYDSYIGGVLRMIEARKPESEISDFLHDIEVREIGVRGNRGACDKAARALTAMEG
jgi:hypothetical protein